MSYVCTLADLLACIGCLRECMEQGSIDVYRSNKWEAEHDSQ